MVLSEDFDSLEVGVGTKRLDDVNVEGFDAVDWFGRVDDGREVAEGRVELVGQELLGVVETKETDEGQGEDVSESEKGVGGSWRGNGT